MKIFMSKPLFVLKQQVRPRACASLLLYKLEAMSALHPAGRLSQYLRCHTPQKVREIAQAWSGSGKWTPEFLEANMPSSIAVKTSRSSKYFMYNEGNQRHLLPDSTELRDATSLLSTTPAEMFRLMGGQHKQNGMPSGEDESWYYFTSRVQDLGDDIYKAAEGWASLVANPKLSWNVGNPEFPSVWIGGAGTSTTAHYDVMDNTFVQVYGRKKFRLWGPNAVTPLCVFPDLHVRARKSQISDTQGQRYLDMLSITDYLDVELGPGDSLFIPAFTFHQVEAIDFSISLNVFSVCQAQMDGGKILSSDLPTSTRALTSSSKSNSGANLAKIVQQLLPLVGISSAKNFIKEHLLEARYAYSEIEESNINTNAWGVHGNLPTLLEVDDHKIQTIVERWETMHEGLLKLERSYDPVEGVDGIRTIIFAHLIESWALKLCDGHPTAVPQCFKDALRQM